MVVDAPLGDAHVDGLDQRPRWVVGIALPRDPVETADVPAEEALPRVVEDLDRPQAHPRGDADDATPVVDRTDRSGDMRAMAVDVAPCRAIGRGAVVTPDDIEVGDRRDAGVDDGHVGVNPLVYPIDPGRRREARPDPRHAGRDGLAGHLDELVGDDLGDIGIGLQGGDLLRAQLAGEPLDDLAEGAVRVCAVLAGVAVPDRLERGVLLQDDDVAPSGIGAA